MHCLVTQAISDVVITKTVRSEIITVIALGLWQITTQPTSEEYTSICRLLVQKFPVLKHTHGNGYVSCVLAKDHCVSYYLLDTFFFPDTELCIACALNRVHNGGTRSGIIVVSKILNTLGCCSYVNT